MEAPPSKKAKRRVSDTKRQRVPISCDRCKIRKIRCIRPQGSQDGSCAACAQLDLACEATLPRKQRVYASYDQLQLRYRALDSLVKRLFPAEKVDTVEEILALAGRQGIDLSEIQETEGVDLDPIGGPGTELTERIGLLQAGNSSSTGTNHSPDTCTGTADDLFDSIQHLHIPEGQLIPAPRGAFHYVGPASSYLFANTVRELVKKASINTLSFDRLGYKRQQRANEFTSSNRTTALEARIQGHPITIADEDESSDQVQDQGKGQGDDRTPICPSESVANGGSPLDRPTPRSIPRSLNRNPTDLLPSRELADRLVTAFFDRVHVNFPLFHRDTFQIRYEALWPRGRNGPTPVVDADTGWVCALYMVFVLGAQSLERDALEEATAIQGRYLAIVVRDGLQRLVLTATIANVQALALLSLYQHNAGERNTAWMLIGHAARMAVALGMQRDGETGNFDFVVRNLRRNIWWTLFLFEQNLSFILGRPSATSTIDISASLPDESASEAGRDAPVGYLARAVKLGEIAAKVKRFTAAISAHYNDRVRLASTTKMAQRLDQVLLQWQNDLPSNLRPSAQFATIKHRRAVQLLSATFFHLRSVLGRPYLLCRVDHDVDAQYMAQDPHKTVGQLPSGIWSLAEISLEAARNCITALFDLALNECLEGEVWYDIYYIHHASLILSLPCLVDVGAKGHTSDRALISTALNLAQRSRLAPTYRILINVSIQFARIVGIGPDDDPSRPPSPKPAPNKIHADSSNMNTNRNPNPHPHPHSINATTTSQRHGGGIDPAQWLTTLSTPSGSDTQISPSATHLSGPSSNRGLTQQIPPPRTSLSSANLSETVYPNDPTSIIPYSNPFPLDQTSSTHSWHLMPAEPPSLSLEHLLGLDTSLFIPNWSSNFSGQQHFGDYDYTDLHNFGFGTGSSFSFQQQNQAESASAAAVAYQGGEPVTSGIRTEMLDETGMDDWARLNAEIPWDFFGSGEGMGNVEGSYGTG